jgi:hypothetical protein
MIGRAPMMPPPGFGSPFPVQSAAPNFGSSVPSQAAAGYGIPAQPARPQLAQQQAPAPRVIRGQRPDEQVSADQGADAPRSPRRQPALHMPSPEELGVPGLNPCLDWTAVHNQLDRLGATCFHLERTPKGGYRITCLLPTNQRDRTHRIEAEASAEADAVRLVLAKAQEWAGQR